jgi:alpha-glucosidase
VTNPRARAGDELTLNPGGRPWWEAAVVYQIYPRSFQDSNGDGIGDLRGITSRLDEVADLGVDAVWLSPIFPSPMADFGYDVADYCDVDPMFGTLADLDALVAKAHALGLRVLLDYVPSHTSSEHPWFRESRSSRDNPRRDWYLWSDPGPHGAPPTNWLSMFGGPGWEWDEATGQFYFHAFLREQPDLNWRNPAVRRAMYDALRFWLDRGIDGFRVDVMWLLIKDDELRDNPPNPDWAPTERRTYDSLVPLYTADRPEVQEIVGEMRAVLDEYGDRVLIGEIYLPVERLVAYYGTGPAVGAHLPFNFQLLRLPWDAATLAAAIADYERLLPPGGWPNWVLGNHDNPRIATRVGEAQARVAAMLLLTLRGTPTMYYGDEIGMVDADIPEELQQDPARHDGPGRGRDPERTPMRWDASRNGGFTDGTPWLPIGRDLESVNVASRRAEAGSILHLYRELLRLRRSEPALSLGSWAPIAPTGGTTGDLLAYERAASGRRFVVALNLGHEPMEVPIEFNAGDEIVLSTHLDRTGLAGRTLRIRADEGVIVRAGAGT